MRKNQIDSGRLHTWLVIPIIGIGLVITACGGGDAPKATPAGGSAAPAPSAQAAPKKPAPGATSAPQAQNPSNVDCAATYKANLGFGRALAPMVNFTADTDYGAFTDPSSPVYLDFAKVRGDLTTLAALPDPTDAVELTFGKPSESVAYFRQVVDIAEGDVKTQGKPFHDTSSTGQKVIGIDTPWIQELSSFGLAMDKACSGFTLPPDTPVSSEATNHVGETATLGDLRVTLEKVSAVPGVLGNLPDSGNVFVFMYVTIENAGKVALATSAASFGTLSDSRGTLFYMAPNAIMLAQSNSMNGEVAPGDKTSGTIPFQVPANAGDLKWTIQDNVPHRAVFAIKASEIVADGAPVGESTASAYETGAAATIAALVQMSDDADATAAAMTAVPVTDEPAATDEPTSTEEPTATP